MKQKVLFMFDAGLGCGGIESFIMNVVRSMHDFFIFDILVCTNESKINDCEFKSYGGKIFKIPYYEGNNNFRRRADYYIRGPYLYKKSKEIISENMPYVAFHCNNVFDAAPAIKAAKELGIRNIIEHAHSMPSRDPFIRMLLNSVYKKIAINNCTHLVGCSEETCRVFYNKRKFHVINNPYDDLRFKYSKDEGSCNYNHIHLIQVGRFCDIKNQIFTVGLLAELMKKKSDTKLTLVGSNESKYCKEIINLVNSLHLEKNVDIYPVNADIASLLKRANAFVMPSKSEGFGIAAIEAQAVGLQAYLSDAIPISTNCGGCTYISLNKSKEEWANIIWADFLKGKLVHSFYDCSKYNLKNVKKQLIEIYNN